LFLHPPPPVCLTYYLTIYTSSCHCQEPSNNQTDAMHKVKATFPPILETSDMAVFMFLISITCSALRLSISVWKCAAYSDCLFLISSACYTYNIIISQRVPALRLPAGRFSQSGATQIFRVFGQNSESRGGERSSDSNEPPLKRRNGTSTRSP
jgi:hypothetical protein